jgi:hypothetical protein
LGRSISQPGSPVTNQLNKGKDWFQLIVPEVSVHGCLVPLLWVCGEVEHHGRKSMVKQSCSPHGTWETKWVKGRGQVPISPSRAEPQWSNFLPLGPTS